MKNELLYVLSNDEEVGKEIVHAVNVSDGEHTIVGKAKSATEMLHDLKKSKPTVVVVYYPNDPGEAVRNVIKSVLPETQIITYSKGEVYEWGDANFNVASRDVHGLIEEVTKHVHKK